VQHGLSNPGASEIARILRLVGTEDVFVDVELPDGSDIEKRIKRTLGVRNSIAHGGVDTAVMDDQVGRYLEAVEYLGRSLDTSAGSIVQEICGMPEPPGPSAISLRVSRSASHADALPRVASKS
jgi:hypothetical protein